MKRMRTRPFQLTSGYMKNLLQGALDELVKQHGRGIMYREEWEYSITPSIESPYTTKIVFHGHKISSCAYTTYQGPYGEWEAWLKNAGARLTQKASHEEIVLDECTQICGMPRCTTTSDLYRESTEQRRARARELATQGIV